jgi:glycosyltransferase involved in cell wall biosynthesis
MRILFVTHRFLPRYVAGTELYSALMAQELVQLGHQVQIFTGDPSVKTAYDTHWNGLPVQAVPWGVGPWPGAIPTYLASFTNPAVERRFEAVCRAFRPDIVHIQHLMGLSPRLPAIAQRCGARVVITLHDYWFACSNTWLFRSTREQCPGPGNGYYCGGCALHRLQRRPQPVLMALAAPIFAARTRVLRRALLQADYLIAPSQAVANRFAGQGVPLARLNVIAHGIINRPPPPPGLPAAGLRFVYVGSLTPPKGVHIAIQAFSRLVGEDLQFEIYGNLTEDVEYVRELRGQATHPGIAFRGPLAHDLLDQVLGAAHMLLLPSLWDESFSIIMDEAVQAGVPVLISDRGGPKERLLPGLNGLMATAGDVEAWYDKMRFVAENRHVLSELRRGARFLKQAPNHARELADIYTHLGAAPIAEPK